MHNKRIIPSLLVLLIACAFFGSLPIKDSKGVTMNTTLSCVTSTSDGWITKNSRNATSGDVYNTDPTFWCGIELGTYFYRSFLFFDTSAIPPNATVTSANLHFHVETDVTLNDFNVTIQSGMPTYPHDPLVSNDYFTGFYDGAIGGSNNTINIAGSILYITLNDVGRGWINKDGLTKLVLRAYNDTANQPTIFTQYLMIYARESGILYPPILTLVYSVPAYQFVIHAPYYENGNVAPTLLKVNITRPYNTTFSFTLNGVTGEKTYLYNDTNKPLAISWNISTSYNQTRTIFFKDDYEEVYLYVPDPHQYAYLYTFTIIDFVGVTNAYFESSLIIGGQSRTVERHALTVSNDVLLWLVFQNRYRLTLYCDQGSYSWGDYLAGLRTTEIKSLLQGYFDIDYAGYNTTCTAKRMSSTWAQLNYTDNKGSTGWLYVALQSLSSTGIYLTRWSMNITTQSTTQNLNFLNATDSYRLWVKAHRVDGDLIYAFSMPAFQQNTTQVWSKLSIFGVFVFPLSQLLGVLIVLLFFSIFSYFDPIAGCFIGWLIAMFLWFINWLSISPSLMALAGAIIVLWAIGRYRERQRLTGLEA